MRIKSITEEFRDVAMCGHSKKFRKKSEKVEREGKIQMEQLKKEVRERERVGGVLKSPRNLWNVTFKRVQRYKMVRQKAHSTPLPLSSSIMTNHLITQCIHHSLTHSLFSLIFQYIYFKLKIKKE